MSNYIPPLRWGRELCDMTIPQADEIKRRCECYSDLLAACEAALAVLPGLEVRSWPPGHAMKKDAIEKLKAAIEKATPTAHSPPGERETP